VNDIASEHRRGPRVAGLDSARLHGRRILGKRMSHSKHRPIDGHTGHETRSEYLPSSLSLSGLPAAVSSSMLLFLGDHLADCWVRAPVATAR
jgi:hypothetical protein